LAGSLATRLGALVWVPHTEAPDLASAISAVCAENALDPGRTVIVGEGGGCHAAFALCGKVPSARIALLYPPALPGIDPHSFPTTLLQASATSSTRAGVVMLESSLRRAGVAVRETDYQDIADDWARYPRAVRGSKRALGDLVAFLERGVGQSSTFEVIPGWDLH
ncbi:MAG: hypothetical protein H7146_13520, partial [Burkholderiaceae bacterium]|nr:hypothetical protein [Microbacteriaceae bacterium]